MEEEKKIKVKDSLLFADLGEGEVAVLDQATMRYFTLNETGIFIMDLLKQEKSLDEILTKLTEEYEVSEEKAREAINEFVQTLEKESLVERGG